MLKRYENMKQLLFLFFTACALVSCSGTVSDDTSDFKVDSLVNAKVDAIRIQMKANNDSLINAMARERADSILKTMKK